VFSSFPVSRGCVRWVAFSAWRPEHGTFDLSDPRKESTERDRRTTSSPPSTVHPSRSPGFTSSRRGHSPWMVTSTDL